MVFDPLLPGLSAEHEEFLGQLAASLPEKPGSRLIIISKVTNQDIMALRRQSPAYAGTVAVAQTGEAEGKEPGACRPGW